MNLQEALRIIDNFGYDFKKEGGRAMIPSRVNRSILDNNIELRQALAFFKDSFKESLVIDDESYKVTKRISGNTGKPYIHWIRKSYLNSNIDLDLSEWGVEDEIIDNVDILTEI